MLLRNNTYGHASEKKVNPAVTYFSFRERSVTKRILKYLLYSHTIYYFIVGHLGYAV